MTSLNQATDAPPPQEAGADDPPSPDGWRAGGSRTLAALRAELDRIDDALHDLLMERAGVVEQVARAGKRGVLRPGREAAIIRRLLARHHGGLPAHTLARIWRELLAGTTAMQGGFGMAVCTVRGESLHPGRARAFWRADAAARPSQPRAGDRRGQRRHRDHRRAAAAVRDRGAARRLVDRAAAQGRAAHPCHRPAAVLARRARRARPHVHALVVAAVAPDASGADRSLLGLELPLEVSRARLTTALAAAGFEPGRSSCAAIQARRQPTPWSRWTGSSPTTIRASAASTPCCAARWCSARMPSKLTEPPHDHPAPAPGSA